MYIIANILDGPLTRGFEGGADFIPGLADIGPGLFCSVGCRCTEEETCGLVLEATDVIFFATGWWWLVPFTDFIGALLATMGVVGAFAPVLGFVR